MPGESRPTSGIAKRILFFPLGNVLGHLTRTFALAEELDAAGHEVTIAARDTFPHITKALPRSIRRIPTPEMYKRASEQSGAITHYGDGTVNDRENIESSSLLDAAEQRRRNRRITHMVARDRRIVAEVRPHAIITDFRFTTQLMGQDLSVPVFHISNLLGYPSLYRRVFGEMPFPLNRGHILVPSVREVEYCRERPPAPDAGRRETFCGVFRWHGWQRLAQTAPPPPRSDVFLFFGSTGNSRRIVPYLLRQIPERHRVSCIASGAKRPPPREHAHVAGAGSLDALLENTRVVFCHGGHGTVLQCILRRTPMVIFPHNLEQLEIGRRIETMSLGVLVKKPYHEVGPDELDALIARAGADTRIRASLDRYSVLLRESDGARRAAATVLRCLESGDCAA